MPLLDEFSAARGCAGLEADTVTVELAILTSVCCFGEAIALERSVVVFIELEKSL